MVSIFSVSRAAKDLVALDQSFLALIGVDIDHSVLVGQRRLLATCRLNPDSLAIGSDLRKAGLSGIGTGIG